MCTGTRITLKDLIIQSVVMLKSYIMELLMIIYRQKKFKFCNQLDPNSVEQDGYRHLISGKGKHSGPSGMELITLPDFMYRKL